MLWFVCSLPVPGVAGGSGPVVTSQRAVCRLGCSCSRALYSVVAVVIVVVVVVVVVAVARLIVLDS